MKLLQLLGSLGAALHMLVMPAAAQQRVPAPATADARLAGLDRHILAAMKQWGTVGTAVAVVEEGRVIFIQGFGVRDLRTREPVDADTIFAIGSMTKALTAVAGAVLVDEKRMSFDDRIVRWVPGFAVGDPYITGAVTIRDALSHRTGYDWRLDPLLLVGGVSREDLGRRLRNIEPELPFRAQYGYSNVLYLMGSEAIASAAGEPWGEVVRSRILQPLAMTRTSTNFAALDAQTNVATPHRNFGEGARPIPWRNIDLAAGAGAMNSSARDMAAFVSMMAAGGRFEGRPFLKVATYDEMLTPQISLPVEAADREFTNFHGWGIGWELMDYKGRKIALHGGAIDGMLAEMAIAPSEKLGIVVLTNTDGVRNLPRALILNILDRFLGGPRPNHNAAQHERGLATQQLLYGTPPRIPGTRTTLPLGQYAGEYEGKLGRLRVRAEGGRLLLLYAREEVPMQHWHHDTFRTDFGAYGQRLTTFILDHTGRPARLDVELMGEFRRVPAQQAGE